MRLLEAIIDANHRALAGDAKAGIRPDQFVESLPLVALTCIDPRLNPLMPEVLGISEEQFIWLRNAGNIITGTLSSTMRSLALACAVKGGREIALIGHTDCKVRLTSAMELTEAFSKLGISRGQLPDNLTDYFGLFASERQNVIRGVEFIRQSPLIGPAVPVHGLIVDIQSGKLEWLVNGYQQLELKGSARPSHDSASPTLVSLPVPRDFEIGDIKSPELKIGDLATSLPQAAPPPLPSQSAPPGFGLAQITIHHERNLKESEVKPEEAVTQDTAAWFKVIGDDARIYGPLSASELASWIREGRVTENNLAQRIGYPDWKPLSEFAPMLRPSIPKPPAIPKGPARGKGLLRPWR